MKNIILILIAVVIILIIYTSIYKKEPYSPMVIPFDYESPVKQMQLDKFYERVINNINNYDQYGNPIPVRREGFSDSLDRQDLIIDPQYYYNKYRECQNKVANLENILVRTQENLDAYKKSLIFCRRELTLEPIVAKWIYPTSVLPTFEVVGNTLSGVGVETQFKQANTDNA